MKRDRVIVAIASAGLLVTLAACGPQASDNPSAQIAVSSPPVTDPTNSTSTTTPTSRASKPQAVPSPTRPATTTPRPTTTTTVKRPPGSSTRTTPTSKPDDKLPPGALTLPTHGSDHYPKSLWSNVDIVTNADHTCVWILGADGDKQAALWWPGYYAMFEPLRILDDSGRELWREGQRRDIGGGGSPVHVDRIPAKCRTGEHAWWMGPLEPMD